MLYQKKKIAERLRAERKAMGLTQEALAAKIHYSKPVINSWERPNENNQIPSMEQLAKLSNLYECEIGYLLCEYDCKTRAATDIQKETGLSREAVELLCRKKDALSIVYQLLNPEAEWKAYFEPLGISTTDDLEEQYKYFSEQAIIPDFASHLITSDSFKDVCSSIINLARSNANSDDPNLREEYERIGKQNFGASFTEIVKAQAAATNREFQEHLIEKRLEAIVHDYIDKLYADLNERNAINEPNEKE